MIHTATPICIEKRFDTLRGIISQYHERLTQMEATVVELFATNQLAAISKSIEEKHRIERLVKKLEHFVEHWEEAAEIGID
ncbi:hypothetical protein [Brevibacillus dissolubilis]|uniref:hypothetical protein n=1 Tax=Brevibacillus dissolubilis TaxID=1844116 RepID=UPI0011165A43|nr:hypothetical protein [Brevibacillus dissolubilis]